jgi:Phosphopentomutase
MSVKPEAGNIEINSPPPLPPSKGRMLVILLDSTRKDSMFSEAMPFISSLRENGAWGISGIVSTPLSVAGDHAIFAGATLSPLSIVDDFSASIKPSAYDNLFRRVTQQKKRAVIFSSDCLRGAYGSDTDLSVFAPNGFLFSQYREDAKYIFDKTYNFLKNERWDLTAVQFVTMDFIGHLETPLSPNYSPTLKLLDNYVRQLVELTTDNDIVLITAEHGIDANGFHVDRTEFVIDTPFILTGPGINKGGPKKLIQIDWAPTLSILAGVSPFYKSPALPALDLLSLPSEYRSILLSKFSQIITGNSDVSDLDELRKIRLTKMGRKSSPALCTLIVLATLCSLTLFAFVALSSDDYSGTISSKIKYIGFWICSLCILTCIELYFGVLNYISNHFPFSANNIFGNPVKIGLALILMAILPMYYGKITKNEKAHSESVSLPLFLILIFSIVFIVTNPYHPLNWAIVCIPIFSWGVTRHPAWLVIFFAILAGMAIRRLTFYHVYHPITMPSRWVLSLIVLLAGIAFLFWRLRFDKRRIAIIGCGIIGVLPCIVIIACPLSVGVKTILLLLSLVALVFASRRTPKTLDILMALWIVFFYLGTSGNMNHVSHIVAFPLLLAVWSISGKTSAVAKGSMVVLVVCVLYLLPGNEFDLKIYELRDEFIMGSVIARQIGMTVIVIGSRYIVPVTILVWIIKQATPRTSLLSMCSVTMLPLVFGIGISLTIWTSSAFIDYPWDLFAKLTILFGFSFIIVCAFSIVSVCTIFIYPYYLKFRAK